MLSLAEGELFAYYMKQMVENLEDRAHVRVNQVQVRIKDTPPIVIVVTAEDPYPHVFVAPEKPNIAQACEDEEEDEPCI